MQINYTFDSNIYVPDSNSSDFLTELQTNLLGSTVPDPEIREINPHYRGFVQAVQAACAIFDNDFADNITVTIQFDFGAVTGEGGHSNNEIPAGATGANMLGAEPNPTFSYSDVHGYLQHELTAKSGDTFFTQAFGTLPSSWNNSGTFALTYPQLKAMGQYNASAGEIDGYVGLADTYYWTSGGMVEVLEHEISEVLGRGAGTIVQGPRDASQRDDGENTYTPLDLFRYSAGSPDLVANGGAYFSIDGGITSGGPYYDPTASGDPDAEDFNVADPFGYSTITSGYVVSDPTFSEVDFNEMDVIGYDPIYTNLKKGAAVTHFGVRAQHYLEVEGGQSTSAILSGGDEDVYAGGLDVHATVGGGSLQTVWSGGTASGTFVVSGGGQQVIAGGLAVSATVGSGGGEYVDGDALGTICNGGYQEVDSGGTARSATINDGGIQDVLLGATAIGTTLSGGAMSINGGTASSTRVCAGGVQDVDIGGTAIGTTVGSGGLQRVADELSSSTASDTTVSSGGTAAVYGGGVLTGAVVDNGTVIFGGGTLSGNLTGSGSLLIESYKPVVLSGADAFRGSISISGSTLELSSATAAGSGSITIADTDSILQIDGPGMPTNIISGFQPGDLIDLQGVTFAADESVSLVGSVLHVVENGNSYNLQLDPARSYSDSFVLSLDFTSGTFITLGQQVIAGNATVAPGTAVSGELLVSGASLTVSSGGTADAITVNAYEYVSAGGAANNTKVNGIQKVAGIASGTTILATQYVLSGGTTCETAIIAGGHQYVAHGGISSDTLIDGGAWGSLFGQPSGSLQILGGEAFDTTITGNGVQVVQGGTAIGTTISSGGTQSASNDPNVGVSLISNTVIDSGGILDNGDIAVNVTVNSAGVFNNYASAVSTTVNSGGIFNVDGSAVGSRVNSGGVISISGTETIIATGIDSFASVWVPGMASATTLSGGEQVVASGGSAAGTIISGGSGGLELIDAGGSANGTQVYSGGLQSIFGATSGTTVNSGGSAWIDSGGSAAQMLVGSDGHATVLSGGAANGATISGGLLELASGGSAVGAVTFAGSGGVLQVDDPSALGSSELVVISGIAPGDAIDFRNVAYSSSGSVSLNSAVNLLEISENNANHFIEFDPHQNLAKTSFLLAPDSGSGSLVVVGKLVPSGNTVSGSSLSQGFEVVSGNSVNTAVNSGGIELIYSGATDTESTVNDNGFQYVYSGGAASNTVLNDPGEQIILAGGLASGAILSGGRQVVFGNVGGTIIGSDGLQVVESGGVASGSILQAGGTSYIYSFGQEVGAQISGGNSDVFGNATRDTIFAGSQVVESGGTASNTAVFSGGVEVVSSGGTAVVTTISGGKEELAAGAVASGAITFAGTGGTLKIDGTVMPANVVSGFVEGDTFDLAGVAFSSGGTVQVVSGHVLQVVENATTYNLQLDSSVSYATDAFRLTSDGSGGTDVIIHGPALSNIATSASYTEEGGAITLATSGTITDQDSTTLIGATVAITGGTFANDADVLAATTSGTSITASYSSGTETLTLSGTDTLAHYQQVLRSVSFVAGENPTNYGNNPTRTVTWTVNDGGASFNLSPPQATTIGITNLNDPPVLSNVASTVAFHSGTTTTLSPNTSVSDPDDLTLVGGTVIVTSGGFANDGDVLAATTSGTSITATYNSGTETLTLSGTDTLAHYQSVLDSVTLASGNNPTNTGANRTRTVTWQVNDGEAANNLSTPVQTTVNITTIDSSRPVVTPASLAVNQSHLHTVAASTLFTAGDADGDFIVQYDFWDTGVSGAHWIINGTPRTPNTDNYASNLSQVSYQSGDGTDTLYVRASDGTSFGSWSQAFTVTDTAPVVTATSANVTVSHQNPVSATSLFTASDADGDPIVQYDFWDSGSAGGTWLLNGVAQPNNQILSFSASQLPQITYQGGAGTETIWERASDGIQYSAWVSVNATDTAPVVTLVNGANRNVGHGTVAATSLFTAADADADSIVQYDFWDSGQAGGHWLLNGVALANNQENFVNASQLSLVTYCGGNGTETIYERASDGIQFSAWVAINATGTDTAPVVRATSANVTVSHQIPVSATSLFTASDADGDPIVQYDFWDSGSAGGTWLLNGNPLLLGADNFVSATQLSQVTYRGGAGTETIWERASDGVQFSAWVSVNATDTAPVSTPVQSEVSAFGGKTFAVSSLFTVNDADGDTSTQYDAWSNGGGGGHWMVGSTVLGTAQDNFLTPAQFAQLTYVAGTSTDTIWVRASDGLRYGAWSNGVTVTDAPVANPTSNSVLGTNQQTFAATSLFTAGDADGDNLTQSPAQYDFWDTGSGGGHWVINGTPGMTNTDNFVNAAQLSQVTYKAGNGTDTLWVRVNDGTGFGPWSSPFTVSDPPQAQTVQAGETLEVASAFSGSVTFAGASGMLKLDNSASFSGTVAGMAGQDALDLADIDPTKVQQPTYSGDASGGMLTVTDGTHTANIALLGNYMASTFAPSSDGHGGTNLVDHASTDQTSLVAQPSH